ncbi:MAG: hypothetical protein WC473_02545 [Patescibacteria group bacterium]
MENIRVILGFSAGMLFIIGLIPYGIAIIGYNTVTNFLTSAKKKIQPFKLLWLIERFINLLIWILNFKKNKKRIKPSKVSWVIWFSIDLLTFSGMVAAGTLNGQMTGVIFGAGIILLLALIYGESTWTKLDKLCLLGAAAGLSLWLLFDNPLMAIIASASVGFIGSIPTLISAWRDPDREDKLAWTIFWLSCACAVLAIPRLTAADAIQPLDFFLIESIMMLILYFNPTATGELTAMKLFNIITILAIAVLSSALFLAFGLSYIPSLGIAILIMIAGFGMLHYLNRKSPRRR